MPASTTIDTVHCRSTVRLLDAREAGVVRFEMEELTYSDFTVALASGVPVLISGVHRRLQGRWTPEALTASIDKTTVSCVDCNSRKESIMKMQAKAFFDLLSSGPQPGKVYKVKVRVYV